MARRGIPGGAAGWAYRFVLLFVQNVLGDVEEGQQMLYKVIAKYRGETKLTRFCIEAKNIDFACNEAYTFIKALEWQKDTQCISYRVSGPGKAEYVGDDKYALRFNHTKSDDQEFSGDGRAI
jgi:hypothetical protein